MVELFPFAEYWSFYLGFTLFVCAILLLDLGVFNRKVHEISVKEAAIWSVVFVSLALLFNAALYAYCLWKFPQDPRLMAIPGFDPHAMAHKTALEFLAGLFVEKSLAVDNIFVFIVVFNFFGIPRMLQHRVLFFGIVGALVFRAIFIALGSVLMSYYFVVIFFGLFLIFTGVKMIFASDEAVEPEKNIAIRILKRFIPIHPKLEGSKFFIRINGVLHATPLFVCMILLEVSDIIFALDSVPAIFGLTKEPFIVYTSNIFAILGLRAMFFLLVGVIGKFEYLKYGLAAVLIFVGCKMSFLGRFFEGGHFPIAWSLIIITVLIGGSVLASFVLPNKHEKT